MANPAAPGDIAIVASSQAAWAFAIDPIHPSNDYQQRVREDYHLPLVRNHYHRDIIGPTADFSPYRVLIVAHQPVVSADTRQRLQVCRNGGVVILGHLLAPVAKNTLLGLIRLSEVWKISWVDSSARFSPHWVEHAINVQFSLASLPRIWCEGFAHARAPRYLPAIMAAGVTATRSSSANTAPAPCLPLVPRSANRRGCTSSSRPALAHVQPVATGDAELLVIPRVNKAGEQTGYGLLITASNLSASSCLFRHRSVEWTSH